MNLICSKCGSSDYNIVTTGHYNPNKETRKDMSKWFYCSNCSTLLRRIKIDIFGNEETIDYDEKGKEIGEW